MKPKTRQPGLFNIASLADDMNYWYGSVKKNQHGTEEKWFTCVQISQKITNIGIKIKIIFFQEHTICFNFLDESTTTGMKPRPAYCGAIGITNTF